MKLKPSFLARFGQTGSRAENLVLAGHGYHQQPLFWVNLRFVFRAAFILHNHVSKVLKHSLHFSFHIRSFHVRLMTPEFLEVFAAGTDFWMSHRDPHPLDWLNWTPAAYNDQHLLVNVNKYATPFYPAIQSSWWHSSPTLGAVWVDLSLSIITFLPITRASRPDNFALAELEHKLSALRQPTSRSCCFEFRGLSVITQEVSLTLHGEGLSRHWDVVLALCGKAVMRQVVFLWEFHQRVICGGGQRSRIRATYKMRNKAEDLHHRQMDRKTLRKTRHCVCHTHTRARESPHGELTCKDRRSAQGDERVRVGLQVCHHVLHHSVHSLEQPSGHHRGLLLNTKTIRLQAVAAVLSKAGDRDGVHPFEHNSSRLPGNRSGQTSWWWHKLDDSSARFLTLIMDFVYRKQI